MSKKITILASAVATALLLMPTSMANTTSTTNTSAIFSSKAIHHPVYAKHGMVSSQEARASKIGVEILKQGGNAVDAAVAVAFALAVTLPRAGNLGGGGFMMIHDAKTGKDIALDYREKAPASSFKDMYLDEQGNVISSKSKFHGLAIGVPGTVAGLTHALAKYGTMSLDQVIQPAIELAENGMVVSDDLFNSLVNLAKRLKTWDETAKIFYKQDDFYQIGDVLKQPDLAKSMKTIAKLGADGFYKGDIAKAVVKSVNGAGGSMSLEDLANYNVVEREPIVGDYRGYKIVSMPPPSSGGVHILEILNILEKFPIGEYGHNSAKTIHLMAEAMKLAYADRSEYLGDPDFVNVPIKGLTSKKYAAKLSDTIGEKARPAVEIKPNNPLPYESNETTHFSVIDKDGNAVSNTYTLNFSYGTGLVAEGTGILLNNEMDDFSAKPGVPNGYGLIGGDSNAVEGGKRPLSSMSPTFVLKDGKISFVTGSPGGSRIITTVLQIIMNVIDHKMNIDEATHALRIHHQWLPDEIRVERGFNVDTKNILESLGHKVVEKAAMGSTQSIYKDEVGLFGSSDPRVNNSLAVGY